MVEADLEFKEQTFESDAILPDSSHLKTFALLMMLWIKTAPVQDSQGTSNGLNVRVLHGSLTGIKSTSFEYTKLHKFAIISPILMIITLFLGWMSMLYVVKNSHVLSIRYNNS